MLLSQYTKLSYLPMMYIHIIHTCNDVIMCVHTCYIDSIPCSHQSILGDWQRILVKCKCAVSKHVMNIAAWDGICLPPFCYCVSTFCLKIRTYMYMYFCKCQTPVIQCWALNIEIVEAYTTYVHVYVRMHLSTCAYRIF